MRPVLHAHCEPFRTSAKSETIHLQNLRTSYHTHASANCVHMNHNYRRGQNLQPHPRRRNAQQLNSVAPSASPQPHIPNETATIIVTTETKHTHTFFAYAVHVRCSENREHAKHRVTQNKKQKKCAHKTCTQKAMMNNG